MIKVGTVTITPIFETDAGEVIQACITDAKPTAIKAIDWLQPHYAIEGRLEAQVQSFLVETDGRKIVIDTCIGNGRNRPELPAWANLQTDFMERFSKMWLPHEVDLVLCTHLHFDHVGWNTTLVNGAWEPTFPNAQYIFCEDEFAYWKGKPAAEVADDHNGFAESVVPVYEAGLAKLVPGDYQVTSEISLIPTPGHTPGHVSILIESQGQSAVISGDAVHHPCQIAHPEWKTFDTDSDLANKTRRRLLERFADTKTVFIGSHFAEPLAGKVKREGTGFIFVLTRDG